MEKEPDIINMMLPLDLWVPSFMSMRASKQYHIGESLLFDPV